MAEDVPGAESPPAEDSGDSPARRNLTMTLPEAVMLTLRDSVTIQSAYLGRVVDKFDLDTSEQMFLPRVSLDGSLDYSRSDTHTSGDGSTASETTSAGAGLNVSETVPTGATFAFSWGRDTSDSTTRGTSEYDGYSSSDSWSVSVTQPLLQGYGLDVNLSKLELARISEQKNIYNLKSTISSQIVSTIQYYRTFLTSLESLAISENALKRSREQMERNKLLIETGRMAGFELLQSESDVANREVSLENARIGVESALKSLQQQLNLPRGTGITPVMETDVPEADLDLDRLLKVAFANRTDWLNSELTTKQYEIYLLQAENNSLWQLDLNMGYGYQSTWQRESADTDAGNWNMGLSFQAPLWGQDETSRKQLVPRARIALHQQRITQQRLQEDIHLELENAVLDVKRKHKRLELARRARMLSERTLAAEQERLNFGRSTNFKVVTFQNELTSAQTNELEALIGYLNSLTSLDQSLGTTLETWRIDFKTQNQDYVDQYAP